MASLLAAAQEILPRQNINNIKRIVLSATIAENVRQILKEINNKPVYTIHELLAGKIIEPQSVYFVGGPAAAIAPGVTSRLGCPYRIPDHSEVANALGMALARTTAEITVLADTEKEVLSISEEGMFGRIP
jgi:sugar (pentulose or hexulose) kinase